ncbi:MAG: DNA repair protein RadA [Paludibacter sp.]|nr:DNA repair protein RadA [Bacteroidales bacterium]MCM1069750.1 DNA repair protein RadA [Prevotella sp.]MCM1354435.1 DNA repair protein RadA [Bacteroides sp.]MCM1443227.1 DNA repair protein RadA [Muribaculum sp.]MCM1482469.1 DNA repair protein RadA [Paludibacter sp.]
MKQQTVYICQSCGAKAPKLIGKCPQCGEWGTYVEELVEKTPTRSLSNGLHSSVTPQRIQEVEATEDMRINMHNAELNRVLGGGLVPGSLVLLGGEPGIGKSTLALQVLMRMGELKTLYASGEESVRQLKLRAGRLAGDPENLYIVSETSLERILEHVRQLQPEVVVVDSIQTIGMDTLESTVGSVGQVRECASQILKYAKESNIPFLIVGHINKEGSLAGPKVLEHIVDTVLQFEGDQHYMYRILRAQKNRFGSTSELGIFEMRQDGLREVSNPSELLLSQNHDGLSGIAIASAVEGVRPFLIEVQALVSSAAYGVPQRSSTGFDLRRLNMLLAVLEKRVGFKLPQKDVFLNIAGGLRVNDPAIDLAVLAAVLSSNMDIAIEPGVCLTGEVGLAGEIRPVNRIEQRILEAQKLGFSKILIPAGQKVSLSGLRIKVLPVSKVVDAFKEIVVRK